MQMEEDQTAPNNGPVADRPNARETQREKRAIAIGDWKFPPFVSETVKVHNICWREHSSGPEASLNLLTGAVINARFFNVMCGLSEFSIIQEIYVTPLQDNYSKALPAQALAKSSILSAVLCRPNFRKLQLWAYMYIDIPVKIIKWSKQIKHNI